MLLLLWLLLSVHSSLLSCLKPCGGWPSVAHSRLHSQVMVSAVQRQDFLCMYPSQHQLNCYVSLRSPKETVVVIDVMVTT